MELPTYFTDFLREIRPSKEILDECKADHELLRKQLAQFEDLKNVVLSTFLQGSYRRYTQVRPNSKEKADVDLVVVTNLNKDEFKQPTQALKLFYPFLEQHYEGQFDLQGRSIGIELELIKLDLVITSAPSEADKEALKSESVTAYDPLGELQDWRLVPSWVPSDRRNIIIMEKAEKEEEWRLSPLYIPDREAKEWVPTHPLELLRWTRDKNAKCNGHYINVVKAIKWWRRVNHTKPKRPKGYPLEHIVGNCCPEGIRSVGEGVTRTLEAIVENYRTDAILKTIPYLADRGVPDQNILKRVSGEDFSAFYEQASEAASIARTALDAQTVRESANEWIKLFGDDFPVPDNDGGEKNNKGGFTERKELTAILPGRFAL